MTGAYETTAFDRIQVGESAVDDLQDNQNNPAHPEDSHPASEGPGAHVGLHDQESVEPDDGAPEAYDPATYVSPADADDRDDVRPLEEAADGGDAPRLEWYILKIQSNREDSIREALDRRVKIAGLDKYFGEIIVPIEMVTEFKAGKKKIVKRKLYPGYLVVQMEINEETWFLVRETPGIGDFTGTSGKPAPMREEDIAKIVQKHEEKEDEQPKLKINFQPGDRVKISEGTFENFEGDVDGIDEANGRVTVSINIFGRSTPVELEYWQVEVL
jgi:transcriptional antiterminator NusG